MALAVPGWQLDSIFRVFSNLNKSVIPRLFCLDGSLHTSLMLISTQKDACLFLAGMAGFAVLVGYGLYKLKHRGDMKMSLHLIHMRVAAQGFVVGALTCGAYWTGGPLASLLLVVYNSVHETLGWSVPSVTFLGCLCSWLVFAQTSWSSVDFNYTFNIKLC